VELHLHSAIRLHGVEYYRVHKSPLLVPVLNQMNPIGPGALPASLFNGYPRLFFPGVKWPGHEADHSRYLMPRLRIGRGIPPLPHTSSWRGA
jgi:hypothetical protein